VTRSRLGRTFSNWRPTFSAVILSGGSAEGTCERRIPREAQITFLQDALLLLIRIGYLKKIKAEPNHLKFGFENYAEGILVTFSERLNPHKSQKI
jgi:hypothetical protein